MDLSDAPAIDQTMNIWFWLFEAREPTPNAPIVLSLGGGPGIASTTKVFDGTGPCRFIRGKDDARMNHEGFNDQVDMLYVDHPIPAGFSYGGSMISTREESTNVLYSFLQKFIEEFPHYADRRWGIWAEGYGSHFALDLGAFILRQNTNIAKGRPHGLKNIKFQAVGLASPLIDTAKQYGEALEYANKNKIRQLLPSKDYRFLKKQFETEVKPALVDCGQHTPKRKDCADVVMQYQQLWRNLTVGKEHPNGRRARTNYNYLNINERIVKNSAQDIENKIMKSKTGKWLSRSGVLKSLGISESPTAAGWKGVDPVSKNVTNKFWDSGDGKFPTTYL